MAREVRYFTIWVNGYAAGTYTGSERDTAESVLADITSREQYILEADPGRKWAVLYPQNAAVLEVVATGHHLGIAEDR